MNDEISMAARRVHTTSWQEFRSTYGPMFAACFLGLIAIRVWTQCCLYDRYTATDSGAVTIIGIPFAWQHVKLAALALCPIGKTIVPVAVAEAAERAAADERVRSSRS